MLAKHRADRIFCRGGGVREIQSRLAYAFLIFNSRLEELLLKGVYFYPMRTIVQSHLALDIDVFEQLLVQRTHVELQPFELH